MGLRFLLVGLFGAGAEGRLVGAVVLRFAREHDVAEARFYGVKFGRGDDVFIARGKDRGDFLLCGLDALGRWRMRRENLGDGCPGDAFRRLECVRRK